MSAGRLRDPKPQAPGLEPSDLHREWLLTSGLGGFAMGTLPGVNTRRYHALLVASVAPPTERLVAVRAMVEQLFIDGEPVDLWTQMFGAEPAFAPDGWTRIVGVTPDPAGRRITWTLQAHGVEVQRELVLAEGANAAWLRYRVRGGDRTSLRLRPITPLTPYHELRREGGVRPTVTTGEAGRLWVRRDGLELCMHADHGAWADDHDWWREMAYPAERDRGLDWREDAWSAGRWDVPMTGDDATVTIRFGLGHLPPPDVPVTPRRTGGREHDLDAAADQFIVLRTRKGVPHTSIIAGYPWFADWGRDAMIAAPGLLLSRGRTQAMRSLLELFAASLQRGLIPARFDDDGRRRHYDHVDGSLWFIHAVGALHAADASQVSPALLGACRQIVHAYRTGTDFGIAMDDDGLIAAGAAGCALTWMDAKVDGIAITPRDGKPVEVNALWYHALRTLAAIDPAAPEGLTRLADRVGEGFRNAFVRPDGTCCDRLVATNDGWAPDDTLRPNQVFAASLPHSPLPIESRRAIVDTLGERLLTPFGLRTLAPGHPDYRGRFEGPLAERDAAYHQGTVWPWLLGPYAEAVLRLDDFSPAARRRVADLFQPLLDSLDDGCIGQIAEVYDGDAPHRARGCPAQAWSVGELLRGLGLGARGLGPSDVGPARAPTRAPSPKPQA